MGQFLFNYIICMFCLFTILVCIFINISEQMNKKDYVYISFSLIVIISLLIIINEDIATITVYILPIYYIYRKTKKIIYSIVTQAIICLSIIFSDSIVGFVIFSIMKKKCNKYELLLVTMIIFLFAVIINIIINVVIKRKFNNFGKYEKSKYLIISYIVIIVSCIAICIFLLFSDEVGTYDKLGSILFVIYISVMIIIIYFLAFMYKKEESFKYKQMEFKNLQEYTEKLEEVYTDLRRFKHDYINIISSISGYIDEEDIPGLRKYFEENIYPLNKIIDNNNYKIGLLKNIGIKEIKGLLSGKIIRAEALNIDVVIDIVEYIDYINVYVVDLIRCLGIVLDNAIEAANECDEKIVNIGIIKKNESVIIVVSNSFKGEILSLSKIFQKGVSTKGDNRGLGLSNLKEIIGKYKNVSLDTSIEKNIFIQEICIKN